MSRVITVGAAQIGGIQRSENRAQVIARMIELLRQAKSNGCDLVAFPELTLTTFFPRWYMEDQAEVDTFFEREMPSNETAPLFNAAREWGIGFTNGRVSGVTASVDTGSAGPGNWAGFQKHVI